MVDTWEILPNQPARIRLRTSMFAGSVITLVVRLYRELVGKNQFAVSAPATRRHDPKLPLILNGRVPWLTLALACLSRSMEDSYEETGLASAVCVALRDDRNHSDMRLADGCLLRRKAIVFLPDDGISISLSREG